MMSTLAAMVLGVLVGTLAALPCVLALRAGHQSVALGIVAVLASFTLLTAAIALVRMSQARFLLPFSVPAVLTFLATVVLYTLHKQY